MKKTFSLFIKSIRLVIFVSLSLSALAILALVLWVQSNGWVYYDGFWGNDTPQFIHYVVYHFKNPGFPVTSWDYLWHNGAPRVLDATWINFFFTTPMVQSLGIYQTIKLYPLISFAVFTIFTYLIFYELSKSVLLSLGMAISFLLGRGLYEGLFGAGVVMSTISQAFFPVQFYFLVRFHRRWTYRNLYLSGIFSALGFYFHGALMMFFGFIPSFIFVLFSTHEGESIISKKSIRNAFIFSAIAFGVGAFGSWPQLLHGFIGGSNSVLIPGPGPRPVIETIRPMIKFTDPGIPFAFAVGLLVLLSSFIFKKGKTILRESLPLAIIFGYMMSWFLSCNFGLNPICGILFPGRSFWSISVTMGALAAFFLSPLSKTEGKNLIKNSLKYIFSNALKLIIFIIVIANFFILMTGGYFFENIKAEPILNKNLFSYDPADFSPGLVKIGPLTAKDRAKASTGSAYFLEKAKFKPLPNVDLSKTAREELGDYFKAVDQGDLNYRVWTHMQGVSLIWTRASGVPLSSGYFHFWTKNSRLWEGWTYAVMSMPNYQSKEIPRDMAEKQALFFLDWYGARNILFSLGSGEWDLAPYLYEDKKYIDVEKSNPKKGYLTLKPGLSGGIVSPVNSPVIGFIGNDEGYMTFLKDIAAFNLNTSYLVPIRLGSSVGDLNNEKLKNVQALIIYNYSGGGWDRVYQFAKNGGLVWIETGGNVKEREKGGLPQVFPITSTKYGSLGKKWEAGGELTSKIDFSTLENLVYKNTDWNLSYALESSVKEGAKILLTQKGNPVAVSMEIGGGKVLWSGGNFWYRPEEYRQNGMNELKLVEEFLLELFGQNLASSTGKAEVILEKPEKITVNGVDFSGIVFKENLWPGWNASVKSEGKTKNLSIYTAGPEFMYIPMPPELKGKDKKVVISYSGDPFHWFSFFVSLVSLLIVLDLLSFKFLPKFINHSGLNKQAKKVFMKSRVRVSKWWEKDEEDEEY